MRTNNDSPQETDPFTVWTGVVACCAIAFVIWFFWEFICEYFGIK